MLTLATAIPATCTACHTPIPAGATRCIQCGRVYGDDNRCPTCHAFAAVRQVGDSFVCAACGAPRLAAPGTFLEPRDRIPFFPAAQTRTRAKSVAFSGGAVGLKLVGVATAFSAMAIAGFIALIGGATAGAIPAALVALFGVGTGALMWGWGSRVSKTAGAMSLSAGELEILTLAEKKGGALFATDVARAMGIGVSEAEARLTALADGTRVVMEVTEDGLLRFDFRELRRAHPRVSARVAAPDQEVAEATLDENSERERTNTR